MSKMAELAWEIEQLYIEGLSAKKIAKELGCPVQLVEDWIKYEGVADSPQEDTSPYATINS
jgi:uncharacterized protein YjcR